jgi:hypothetical protein
MDLRKSLRIPEVSFEHKQQWQTICLEGESFPIDSGQHEDTSQNCMGILSPHTEHSPKGATVSQGFSMKSKRKGGLRMDGGVGGRRLVFCLGVRWWALFVLPVLSFS